jgi:5'-nucleotidase
MRVQGSSVKLKIGTMSQNVIISKFSFRYVNDHYVPYDIELQPVASMSVQSATTSTSLLSTALQAALSGVSVSSIVKNAAGQALTNVTTAAVSTTLANILQAKATGNPSLSVVGVALAATTQTTHIVGSGESLYSIAQSIYGDGTKWPTIASANSISNPLSIAIGQKIIIPSQTGS